MRVIHLLAALCAILVTNCITYRNFPTDKVGVPPKKAATETVLYYRIIDNSNLRILGGPRALEKAMQSKTPYANVDKLENDAPDKTYVKITITRVEPSVAALVFGSIGLGTFTIIPFWSESEGYDFIFEIRKNGQKQKQFEYEVRRSGFVWIAMIPVAWVNLITYSEPEAFEAVVYKFFDDAAPFLPR